jgi:glycosyltransferase involved in cell wall biosynthesis
MLKIVVVVPGLGSGGAESMLHKLLAQLVGAAIRAKVVCLSGETRLADSIRALGVEVSCLGLTGLAGGLAGFMSFRRAVRAADADAVQGWMVHGNLAASAVGATLGLPVYWSVRHSYLVPGDEKTSTIAIDKALALLSLHPRRIIYNSYSGQVRHERMGYAARKSLVIPNGFDTQIFAPSQTHRSSVRGELSVPPDAMLVGIVGRFHPMKDHGTFLSAAHIARRAGFRATFLVVGRGCDTANSELMRKVDALGLHESVRLLGERDDIARITAALDIATLTSRSGEGFPNAIGEAMAVGVPCVATDVGDCRRIIGDCGIIVSPGNPEALASAWQRLSELGADGRRTLGECGRQRIAEHFSIAFVARQYLSVYRGET